jgi:hypothetical protein
VVCKTSSSDTREKIGRVDQNGRKPLKRRRSRLLKSGSRKRFLSLGVKRSPKWKKALKVRMK